MNILELWAKEMGSGQGAHFVYDTTFQEDFIFMPRGEAS